MNSNEAERLEQAHARFFRDARSTVADLGDHKAAGAPALDDHVPARTGGFQGIGQQVDEDLAQAFRRIHDVDRAAAVLLDHRRARIGNGGFGRTA